MNRGAGIRLTLAVCALALGAAGAPAAALAAGAGTSTTPLTQVPTTTTTPTATTPTTTTPTTTAPAPAVVATPVALQVKGLFSVRGEKVTVPHRDVVVSGAVAGFAQGQTVELVARVNGRVFLRRLLTIARRGRHGHFRTVVRAPRFGHVTIRLEHVRDSAMLSFARSTSFTALDPEVGPGARGAMVQLIQRRLAGLHLYIPQTGTYDLGTELAVDTYHRLLGDGEGKTLLDPKTLTDLLNGVGSFHVRYPRQGQHAEGDLSDQVLAFVNGSKVHWLFPISSGKPSTPTVLGEYQVYRKQPDYTSDGMYFSSFFTGGYAIHGYDPAPDYPASHGCMRLPMVDAIPAYDWIQLGDWVDTYYT